MRVAYGRVSTASGEQLAALEHQLGRLEREEPDLVLTDVESGLVVERAGYQRLRTLILDGLAREVVVTQFSRLGRDSAECDAFVRLCDAFRVRCRTLDEGVVTMATPEDLLMTRLRGSLSEGESMRIRLRVLRGLEEGRLQGKPMRKPCWGYRLRQDRKRLEPDPETFPLALAFIERLKAHGWRMTPAWRECREWVAFRSIRGVRSWLLNPILRGGIGYGLLKNHRHQTTLWGLHQPLLSQEEFAEMRAVVESNRKLWGINTTVKPRLLTGLVRCGECGCVCKYVPQRTIPSVKCGTERCSQCYRSTREEVIVTYAIEQLSLRAAQALSRHATQEESPEALELRRQVASLQSLADPDLEPVIEQKQERLRQLLSQQPENEELARKIADPRWFSLATYEELRLLFARLVVSIRLERQAPAAIDLRL